MGVVFLLSAFLGLADAGRALAWVARKLASPDTPADPERRVLLARALAVGVGGVVAGLSAVGVGSALAGLRIKDVLVRIRDLPPALAGLRVVQISDLHIGPLLRKEWVEGVVARVRALRPDLVAITGDLVDGTVAELREHVAPLARLAEAPRGVYFSTGNHEYYSGVDDWLRSLPTLGIRPLANERVEAAPGLDVAGIHDPTGRGRYAPDLPAALDGRDPTRPVVLLAHQPRQFREAARHGVSLTLSGHTHGGQIWPFSWPVALAEQRRGGGGRRVDRLAQREPRSPEQSQLLRIDPRCGALVAEIGAVSDAHAGGAQTAQVVERASGAPEGMKGGDDPQLPGGD